MGSTSEFLQKAAPGTMTDAEADAMLAARIAAGDVAAYEKVVDAYMTTVFRFCYGILHHVPQAQDVTQETFLRLWTHAGRWSPEGRLRGWLLRVAHNACIDVLRRQMPSDDIDALGETLPAQGPDMEDAMQRAAVSGRIARAMLGLPQRQRTAVMLVYYAECGNIEAAAVMGITVDALESLLARAKRALKGVLEPEKNDLMEG